MECPKCGKEFSESILPFHIERCVEEQKEPKKETKTPKK